MAKKASVDSEAEPRRERRHRRIAEVDKIISRVRAGAEAMQLIWPDGESAELDRNVEELINSLPARDPAAEPEIIEILQVPVRASTTPAHDCGRAQRDQSASQSGQRAGTWHSHLDNYPPSGLSLV